MSLDPIRTSELDQAIATAVAGAKAKTDAATVRRAGEVNPSDPVVALDESVSAKVETKKLRVTVTVTPLIDAPEDRERA